jgi:hypothetical protein
VSGCTGKPSSASRAAGSSTRDSGWLPHRDTASAQPAAVPGTVTQFTSCEGSDEGTGAPAASPSPATARSRVRAAGARPEPFSACTCRVAAS